MDAHRGGQDYALPVIPNTQQPLPRSSSYSGVRSGYRSHGRSGELRRGHSDGDSALVRPSISQENEAPHRPGVITPGHSFWNADPIGRMVAATQEELADRSHNSREHRDRERAALLIADRMNRSSRPPGNYMRRQTSNNANIQSSGERASRLSRSEFPFIGRSLQRHSYESSTSPLSRDFSCQLPRRSSEENSHPPTIMEIQSPRWQPDAEASECPICHSSFSFWFRKHHCRKCGRVVCANCSPHRITIPRQFIVHPPDDILASSSATAATEPGGVDVDEDDQNIAAFGSNATGSEHPAHATRPGLGGGQEVRLCNPCVPDPNPLPPPAYHPQSHTEIASHIWPELGSSHHAHPRQQRLIGHVPSSLLNDASMIDSHYGSNTGTTFNGRPQPPSTETNDDDELSLIHSRPVRQVDLAYAYPDRTTVYGSAPDQVGDERYRHLDSLRYHQHQRHGRQTGHRHNTSLGHLPGDRSSFGRLSGSAAPRPIRRPQLREEDECPICHNALPPKGADGSDTAREGHVEACIATHFSSSTPRAAVSHPSVATQAAIVATSAAPSQARDGSATYAGSSSLGSPHDSQLISPPLRRRTVGMVVYPATEKDCIQDGGESGAECVICFEEFAVGDEMGRLECLCKFHRLCIRQWWDTKGPGSCPVHQQPEAA